MKPRTILLLLLPLLFVGCFKEVAIRTSLILKPLVQDKTSSPYLPLEEVKAYSYRVDTAQWRILSYDDALIGKITNKADKTQQLTAPDVVAEPYNEVEGQTGWLRMELSQESQMVVLVDTKNRLYAYTQFTIPENLPQLYVDFTFQLWKQGFAYKSGKWSVYNDYYVPPKILSCSVVPRVQSAEGGSEETPALNQIYTYAYAADTTQWRIASYADAVAGKITNKLTPTQTRTTPDFSSYRADAGLYVLSVTDPMLMVVVVDKSNQIYAYTKQEVDLSGQPVTFPSVVFRSWLKQWIDIQPGWCVVNQAYVPKEPENPVTPTKR